jgi:hypothetical protein
LSSAICRCSSEIFRCTYLDTPPSTAAASDTEARSALPALLACTVISTSGEKSRADCPGDVTARVAIFPRNCPTLRPLARAASLSTDCERTISLTVVGFVARLWI